MEKTAATRAAHSEMKPTPTIEQCKQSAVDRFMAAADEFKRAVSKEMAADVSGKESFEAAKKLEQLDGAEDEMERCGRELEESVRHVMAAFGRANGFDGVNEARSDTTSSVDGENYSMDADEESNNIDDTPSMVHDAGRTTERVFESDESPKSVLVATLKRENTCLLAKIKLLEKSVENSEVGRALNAELWENRLKKSEANASLAVAGQRALEVECGAERRRVEHLRATITELNTRLTAAEQATCRARMATVLMEAKHAYETKPSTVNETIAPVDQAKPAAAVQQRDQASKCGRALSYDEAFARAEQDTQSQSSTSSDGNQPSARSGSLLRSPTQYQPRKCSRTRCHANSAEDAQAASADDFNSPRTRRSSLHFSPSKTTTPEDRGSRPVRPRSEPPVDLRTTQRPRWKR